jgi:hypothetical protein
MCWLLVRSDAVGCMSASTRADCASRRAAITLPTELISASVLRRVHAPDGKHPHLENYLAGDPGALGQSREADHICSNPGKPVADGLGTGQLICLLHQQRDVTER